MKAQPPGTGSWKGSACASTVVSAVTGALSTPDGSATSTYTGRSTVVHTVVSASAVST